MIAKTQIITGDALAVLRQFCDNSISCCVTSPPYYGLRDYGVAGQIGLEETPQQYVDRLVGIFAEVRRVLADNGTLWLNVGDSYAGSNKGRNADGFCSQQGQSKESYGQKSGQLKKTPFANGLKRKDLIGIPWRLAFAQEEGWYLRQDIIWQKSNCMPESVRDRCTKSHEYIFLLSKSEKYYFDYKAIQEPAVGFDYALPAGSRGTAKPNSRRRKGNAETFRGGGAYTQGQSFDNSCKAERKIHENADNETGMRRKRDVWTIPSSNNPTNAHFATFPKKLVEPCILAGCKPDGIVLDPFIGSGTTAVVAARYGRNCIGIDLNPAYAEIARNRLRKSDDGLEKNFVDG